MYQGATSILLMMILPKRFCSFTEVKNARNKPFDQNQWPKGKPPFSNNSATINPPLFRIENCTFHDLCTAFMANLRGFSGRQLAWDRLEDLRKLDELRGGLAEGERMRHLFWRINFLLLSGATNPTQMYHEAAALATEISPA